MKKVFFIILYTFFYLVSNAQVTIGSEKQPNKGALLDLKMNDSLFVNSTKGLGLPRVNLINIRTETDLGKTMGATTVNTLNPSEHIGLLVFNTGSNTASEATRYCPGVHVWNGEEWIPLKPYPDIKTLEIPMDYYKRGFIYLDPSSPADWPADKEAARAAGKYALGRNVSQSPSPNGTDNLNDTRAGETLTYTVSRFYVGYKTVERKYKIKKSLSCSQQTPDWNSIAEEPGEVVKVEKTFDDGVWMTQNLRTKRLPDGTVLTSRTPANYGDATAHIPDYSVPGIVNGSEPAINENTGLLYNWAAAVAVGKDGGLASFPTTNPKIDQGSGSHPDVIYKGICPQGWHLPSNQEWTDLVNGIVEKTSLFAAPLTGTAVKIEYGVNLSTGATAGVGGSLGQAMKTTSAVNGRASDGRSYTRTLGGFDAYLGGSTTLASNNMIGSYAFGDGAYFWTSSLNGYLSTTIPDRIYVYHASLRSADSNFYQGYHNTFQTFSVRCKKNE